MKEIKPEGVNLMMRDFITTKNIPTMVNSGEIGFGTKLQFWDEGFNRWTSPIPFYGIDTERDEIITSCGNYHKARFPPPSLRDGDPVWAKIGCCWSRVHFKKYGDNSDGIHYYPYYRSMWTIHASGSYWALEYRTPTKQELSESGYTEDQINEMMERWGDRT